MSKFAVFDIDGTLFRSGLYRELVFELHRAKAIPSSVYEAFVEKKQAWHDRTHGQAFREYERAMVDAFNKIIPTINPSDLDAAAKLVVKAQKNNVYFYTRQQVKDLKKKGYTLIAISGSQKELVDEFAPLYDFDIWVGQEYERVGHMFSGKIFETHTNKHLLLQTLVAEHNLSFEDSYGFGDSGGDISMLKLVANPICFNPDQSLMNAAQTAGWSVVIERKNITYKLESVDGRYHLAETIFN